MFLLLPFGVALITRLAYQHWQAWLSWIISSLTAFIAIWFNNYTAIQAAGMVAGVSALGFVSPEIWEAIRAFLRQPRNIGYIMVGAGIIYLLYHPQLVGSILILGIIILGIWIMIRPLFGRRQ